MTDSLGLDDGHKDVISLHDGTVLETHGPARCEGEHCVIHNPSRHPMNDWPLSFLKLPGSEAPAMFRVCQHHHVHPDPDSMAWLRRHGEPYGWDGWHPCCIERCCQPGMAQPVTSVVA